MDKKIIVEIKNVYGKKWVHIISEQKEAINTLTGKKTLDDKDIEALKKLGFTFEVKTAEIKL